MFVEEFEALAAAGFLNVEMHLRAMKDIKIKRVRQVVPEIKQMKTTEPEERHFVAQSGRWSATRPRATCSICRCQNGPTANSRSRNWKLPSIPAPASAKPRGRWRWR